MTKEELLQDIEKHPERHEHDFNALTACCTFDGALDLSLVYAHERYSKIGTNGGKRCDVTSGPCSCGAWH